MNAPKPSIIFIEVPAAGSPKFGRVEKPTNFRRHKPQRELWKPVQPIPQIDREGDSPPGRGGPQGHRVQPDSDRGDAGVMEDDDYVES